MLQSDIQCVNQGLEIADLLMCSFASLEVFNELNVCFAIKLSAEFFSVEVLLEALSNFVVAGELLICYVGCYFSNCA